MLFALDDLKGQYVYIIFSDGVKVLCKSFGISEAAEDDLMIALQLKQDYLKFKVGDTVHFYESDIEGFEINRKMQAA